MSPSRIVRWPAALTLALLALLVVCAVAFLSLRSSGTRVAAELVVISIVMLSVGAALSGGIWWQTGRRAEDRTHLDARFNHLDERLNAIGLQVLRIEENTEGWESNGHKVVLLAQRVDGLLRRVDTMEMMWEQPTIMMPAVARVQMPKAVDPGLNAEVLDLGKRIARRLEGE